ncbi:hypothetical protein [Cystobacter fuscus]|uniref:hypothetical protein n=1 Tax=Cystobacter fuscus TaxID=43 RepID=UPI0037BFB522
MKQQRPAMKTWTLALTVCVLLLGAGCSHTQQPDHRIYVVSEDARGVGIAPGTGGAGDRDCQAEHEQCFRNCWQKSRPAYPHKHDEWYYKRCTADCRKAYNDCMDEQEEEAKKRTKTLEFSHLDQALEWIKKNKTEVAIGTVVIIGGVGFFISTGGSGALILAPLAL